MHSLARAFAAFLNMEEGEGLKNRLLALLASSELGDNHIQNFHLGDIRSEI